MDRLSEGLDPSGGWPAPNGGAVALEWTVRQPVLHAPLSGAGQVTTVLAVAPEPAHTAAPWAHGAAIDPADAAGGPASIPPGTEQSTGGGTLSGAWPGDPWRTQPRVSMIERVAVDPAQLVDEPSADWCRHEVRRLVALRLVVTAAAALAIAVPVVWWQSGDVVVAVAVGAAAGLVAPALRWMFARSTAPLGRRFLRHYLSRPPEYVVTSSAASASESQDLWDLDPTAAPDLDPDLDQRALGADDPADLPRHTAAADALVAVGFSPVATMRADGPTARLVDLYTDHERTVAAVDRATGSTTLLTELVGFRVLVSSSLLVPPTDELVVNTVRDAHPTALVVSHRRLAEQAFRSRAVRSEPIGLFQLAQRREAEAYRQLGLRWGSLLDLRCRRGGTRLIAAPAAEDVLVVSGNRLYRQTTHRTSGSSHRPR